MLQRFRLQLGLRRLRIPYSFGGGRVVRPSLKFRGGLASPTIHDFSIHVASIRAMFAESLKMLYFKNIKQWSVVVLWSVVLCSDMVCCVRTNVRDAAMIPQPLESPFCHASLIGLPLRRPVPCRCLSIYILPSCSGCNSVCASSSSSSSSSSCSSSS